MTQSSPRTQRSAHYAQARFWIGIDLGTSNSAVVYLDQEASSQSLQHFLIPQWIDEGAYYACKTLPSSLYLLTAEEQQSERFVLPWHTEPLPYAVGTWAQEQQGLHPERSIHSAKSWLCYHSVDPHSRILPQSESTEVPRYSPIEVTTYLLKHLRETWNFHFASEHSEYAMEHQVIVLTVPASFDEVAREVTLEAVAAAGLTHVTLLEEPQAAFYSWLAASGISQNTSKEKELPELQDSMVLVIDVGGGTSDFSLVRVQNMNFERVAVSDHILLGGDNIDLSLAASVESKLKQKSSGTSASFSAKSWETLIGKCRKAKEFLLSEESLVQEKQTSISVAQGGRHLFGKTRSVSLKAIEVQKQILEGFFPRIDWNTPVPQLRQHGLRHIGLPYAKNPAITHHLKEFLHSYMEEHPEETQFPDQVLFNGGTLIPEIIQKQLLEQLELWHQEGIASQQFSEVKKAPIQQLKSQEMHLAVAEGAAYSHLARQGLGIRISGGSPRSYYVALNVAADSSSEKSEQRWLCILAQHATADTLIPLPEIEFSLAINRPVQFQMIASTHRPQDEVGTLLSFHSKQEKEVLEDKFVALPVIQTLISLKKRVLKKKSSEIQVRLQAQLNEIGTLSLFCIATEYKNQWKLEFRVRHNAPPVPELSEESSSNVDWSGRDAAHSILNQWYGKRSRGQSNESSGSLYKLLESAWKRHRNQWELEWLRDMAAHLIDGESYRVRSMQHDLNWFKLIGFCMRPGVGASGDEWKMKQLEETLLQGPHKKERGAENEWWISCRRLAAGLSPQFQKKLWSQFQSQLLKSVASSKAGSLKSRKNKKPSKKKVHKTQSLNELWRLVASLEHLPASEKFKLGELLMQRLQCQQGGSTEGWCLARLGSRQLLYGNPVHTVSKTHVESWIRKLLENPPKNTGLSSQEYALILTQLAEYTGDLKRDIAPTLRTQVIQAIVPFDSSGMLQKTLTEGRSQEHHSEQEDSKNTLQQWTLADSLPHGLELKSK